MSKRDGLTGSHIDAPEVDRSLFRHDILYQVEISNRNAARGNNQVRLHGLGKLLAQALNRIARYPQAMRDRACPSYRRFEQVAVAVANLPWLKWLIYIDHLVARSQDRHMGTPYHRHRCPAQRCQDTDLPGADLAPTL